MRLPAPQPPRSFWGGPAFGLVALAVAVACGEEGRAPPPPLADGGAHFAPDAAPLGSPCTTGRTRECSVTLGEHNGVVICVSGQQFCIDGAWGPCETDSFGSTE